jgi:hypothetical protein
VEASAEYSSTLAASALALSTRAFAT